MPPQGAAGRIGARTAGYRICALQDSLPPSMASNRSEWRITMLAKRFIVISKLIHVFLQQSHTPLVLALHICNNLHGLGQRFVTLSELFETLIDVHNLTI
jgi:hypothetical protein